MSEFASEVAKTTMEHAEGAHEGSHGEGDAELPGRKILGVGLFELLAALLLGIAGALAAFAAYSAHERGSEATESLNESSLANQDSNLAYNSADLQASSDLAVFLQWELNQDVQLDQPERTQSPPDDACRKEAGLITTKAELICSFYFSPELTAAFKEWSGSAAGSQTYTPLDDGNNYEPAALEQAIEKWDEAVVGERRAHWYQSRAGRFELAVVFFTLALFFAGISHLFKGAPILMIALIVVSALLLLPGLWSIGQGSGWAQAPHGLSGVFPRGG